ncbi:MAG: ribose 5-phosphate isomerase B [Hydrogenothermaceae bacterium]
MKIAIGSDHGGFFYKEKIKEYLKSKKYEVIDKGTYSPEPVDYPYFGEEVAKSVASGEADRGIIICGTGIGISIAANKVQGIRAALCTNEFMARMARSHNDANVLALGQRVIGLDHALAVIDVFLETEFEGGRHERRVKLIHDIEIGRI